MIYELTAVIKVPVWPFVNPRKDRRLRGVTVKVAEPVVGVKVKRFWAGEMANCPTEFPMAVLSTATKLVAE